MLSVILLAANLEATAPVKVAECTMVIANSYEKGIHVRFRNASAHTITRVTFHVHNGPHSVDVSDHGTFAPGVDIDHELTTPTWELHHGDVSSCTIKSVTFTDGATWTAPPHP